MNDVNEVIAGAELISALGNLGLGGLIVVSLRRPKTLLTVFLAVAAPFPGSRVYQRYSDALALVCEEKQTLTEPAPAPTHQKKKRWVR